MRAEPEHGLDEPEGVATLTCREIAPDALLGAGQPHCQGLAGLAADRADAPFGAVTPTGRQQLGTQRRCSLGQARGDLGSR